MMFRKEEGFTLVELMVVVLIIGILVAIAVPVFLNASGNAQAKSCQANQRTIIGAIQTYNAQNTATQITGTAGTPEVLKSTGTYAGLFAASTGTIKTVPTCPTGLAASGQYVMEEVSVVGDGSDGTTVAKTFRTTSTSHALP